MSERDKLREGDDLAARLLRAGSREEPKQAARRRAERALGLSTFATGVALASSSSAAVSATGAGSGGLFALPVFAKWLTVGLLVGASTIGGVSAVLSALEPAQSPVEPSSGPTGGIAKSGERPPLPALRVPALSDSAPAPAGSSPDAQTGAASHAADLRRAPAVPSGHSPSAQVPETDTRSPLAASDTLALSREVELLERVRAKLRSGKSREALSELDSVAGDIQTLLMEADLLRVEALIAQGERARAEALAAELERRNPGGGQSFRLKRLLGGS